MANLSKNFLIGDVFDRVWNRCKQDENFLMEKDSVLAIGKLVMMNHFSIANSALRKYLTMVDEAVPVSGATLTKSSYIPITTKNYYDIMEVSYGYDTLYHKPPNYRQFINRASDTAYESKKNGRWWFWTQGEDKIRLFLGENIVSANAENVFNLLVIRYPDLSMFTETALKNNTEYLDIPDFLVPFFVVAWTIECYKEAGIQPGVNLINEANTVVERLGDKLTAEERQMVAMNLTNPTD